MIDIVVLTWNQLDTTKNFIESFLANAHIPSRLIVIDNASSDGTRDYLLSLEDNENCKFKIVLNKENKGFVGGMNQGIEISTAPLICLANNDLIFTAGWLREIISIFDKYSDVGVLNPNSNNLGARPPRGVSIDDFASDLRKKHKGVFTEMPFCIGFCMFIRREVINKVGGLSEEFYPFFFEDTDFSMKALKAGYRIGMACASYVWHAEHVSVDKLGDDKERFFARSREVFLKKWGRILRVAWIVNSYQELYNSIDKGIKLARSGNFVWFLAKDLPKDRKELFKENDFVEHSGVKVIKFNNIFDLSWKILKKKKRYIPLISKNKFIQRFFSKFGYSVLGDFDINAINTLKKYPK